MKMKKIENQENDLLSKIQTELNGDFEKDICNIANIQMENNFENLQYQSIGHIEDDGYDLDI